MAVEAMGPDTTVTEFLRGMLKSPDGVVTMALCAAFAVGAIAMSFTTSAVVLFGLELRGGIRNLLFLLAIPLLLVSYIKLNAFSRSSPVGSYVNAVILIGRALAIAYGLA